MGADWGIHVMDPAVEAGDNFVVASTLQKAIETVGGVDLVLTGVQAEDDQAAVTGVMLADLMGGPHCTNVKKLEKNGDGTHGQSRARRRTQRRARDEPSRRPLGPIRYQRAPVSDPSGHHESQEEDDWTSRRPPTSDRGNRPDGSKTDFIKMFFPGFRAQGGNHPGRCRNRGHEARREIKERSESDIRRMNNGKDISNS